MKIKKTLATVSTLALLVFGLALPVATVSGGAVFAADCTGIDCADQGAGKAVTGGKNTSDLNTVIKTVVNIMLFIIGALAVIMIVVGGIRFTISNGNAEQIKSARNTITYAVAGLIVAILAYAIVNSVITQLK